MKRYIERHLETVRRQGGEGLDRRDRARREGRRTNQPATKSWPMVFLLLFAGHETTTHLISGSVFELLKNPDASRLAARRTGAASIWRSRNFCGSSRRCIHQAALCAQGYRTRRRPVAEGRQGSWPCWPPPTWTLRPIRIPSGSICSASRTGTSPSAPGSISASATSSPRIEGRCALKSLFQRWPDLALAVDPSEITWRKRPGLKAINRLPVRTTREALAPVVAGQG